MGEGASPFVSVGAMTGAKPGGVLAASGSSAAKEWQQAGAAPPQALGTAYVIIA